MRFEIENALHVFGEAFYFVLWIFFLAPDIDESLITLMKKLIFNYVVCIFDAWRRPSKVIFRHFFLLVSKVSARCRKYR